MSIVLDATTKSLYAVCEAITSSNPVAIVSYADRTSTSYTPGNQITSLNGATAVKICDAPTSGVQRIVNNISIYNKDTTAKTITVSVDVSATKSELYQRSLSPNSSLIFNGDDWTYSTPGGYSLRNTQIYTSTGASTWTKPAWCRAVRVKVQAGGGGSAGVNLTLGSGYINISAGGGGGGYSEKFILAASLGSTETVTVGVGGTAGTSTGNGGTGGTSSFGSHCTATGGYGSVYYSPGTYINGYGTAGGTGSGGDINIPGQASEKNNGNASTSIYFASAGGDSMLGAGGQSLTIGQGYVGRNYGGGAGGSIAIDVTSYNTFAGITGAQGIVILEEYE